MKEADIHVGWVKNGRAYITVCIFLQQPIIIYLSRLFRVVPFDFFAHLVHYLIKQNTIFRLHILPILGRTSKQVFRYFPKQVFNANLYQFYGHV